MKHKKLILLIIIGLIIIFLASFVSAGALDFNKKYFDESGDYGNYGKVIIKDWWGLFTVEELELKTNTEICKGDYCKAVIPITLHEKGELIEDLRFIDLKTNEITNIKHYQFYIKDGEKSTPYNYEEMNAGNYELILEGNLYGFQKVDWQIKTQGIWITEYAQWNSALLQDLQVYIDFNEGSGNLATNKIDYTKYNFTNLNDEWDSSGISGSAYNVTYGQAAVNSTDLYGNSSGTINFWIKKTGEWDATNYILHHDYDLINNGEFQFYYTGGDVNNITLDLYDSDGLAINARTLELGPVGSWHLYSLTYNTTTIRLYINGSLENETEVNAFAFQNPAEPFIWFARNFAGANNMTNASIDEISIYNRTLNTTDIETIWDSGSGSFYRGSITTTLNSPPNNFQTTNRNIIFNCSATISSFNNISNISLYHNGSSSFILNQTNITISPNTNGTLFNLTIFSFAKHKWNCLACDNASNCDWGDNNLTFSRQRSNVTWEHWNNETYETSNERIQMNITLAEGAELYLAELVYNDSEYSGTITDLGSDRYHISRYIDVPVYDGVTNYTFYWTLTYDEGGGSFTTENTNNHNQSADDILIGDCVGGFNIKALNFTFWDEEDLYFINGSDFKATFFYWLGDGSTMNNFSFDNESVYEKVICIDPTNVTYYSDATIEYNANISGYVTRNYYLDNDTFSNATQNISLYLLNSSASTSFILEVLDQDQQEVEGAIIYTDRYYPGLGEYRVVQMAMTDENGKSVGFFQTEIADYRFRIERNDVIELTTATQKVVPGETPYTLTFIIGESLDKPWADFDELNYLTQSLTFNVSTNITTFIYVDNSGNFTSARLLVEELRFNQTDDVICNTTSTTSSDTITCDLNTYSGLFLAQAFVERDDEVVVNVLQIVIETAVEIIGLIGLFLAWFIILVAGCAFFWHPIAGIIGVDAAVIFVNIMGFVSWSPLFIFSLLGISIILIFVLKD